MSLIKRILLRNPFSDAESLKWMITLHQICSRFYGMCLEESERVTFDKWRNRLKAFVDLNSARLGEYYEELKELSDKLTVDNICNIGPKICAIADILLIKHISDITGISQKTVEDHYFKENYWFVQIGTFASIEDLIDEGRFDVIISLVDDLKKTVTVKRLSILETNILHRLLDSIIKAAQEKQHNELRRKTLEAKEFWWKVGIAIIYRSIAGMVFPRTSIEQWVEQVIQSALNKLRELGEEIPFEI